MRTNLPYLAVAMGGWAVAAGSLLQPHAPADTDARAAVSANATLPRAARFSLDRTGAEEDGVLGMDFDGVVVLDEEGLTVAFQDSDVWPDPEFEGTVTPRAIGVGLAEASRNGFRVVAQTVVELPSSFQNQLPPDPWRVALLPPPDANDRAGAARLTIKGITQADLEDRWLVLIHRVSLDFPTDIGLSGDIFGLAARTLSEPEFYRFVDGSTMLTEYAHVDRDAIERLMAPRGWDD